MALFSGCSDTQGPVGPGVEIAVAPLSLPGIGYACFDFRVANADDQTVTAQGDVLVKQSAGDNDTICSDQYGNGPGGDISYVAPCDADGAGGTQRNSVTVWVDGLYTAGGAPIEADGNSLWQNPCGDDANNDSVPDGCTLTFDCNENQDTAVTFNFTIMRDANQGFFDIAVNFEDIFCSAKFDCENDQGPITLLYPPGDDERGQTAVVALACTAGPDSAIDVTTVLHMNPITVTCDGQDPIVLDPGAGPGNVWTDVDGDNPDPVPGDAVWQYATYRGAEELTCGNDTNGEPLSCNKVYWNVAFGFDTNAQNCTASLSATASTSAAMIDGETPANSTYPYLTYEVDLTGDQPSDNMLCSSHALNVTDSGVGTHYTPVDQPWMFCNAFDGVTVTAVGGVDGALVANLQSQIEELDQGYQLTSIKHERDVSLQQATIQAAQLDIANANAQSEALAAQLESKQDEEKQLLANIAAADEAYQTLQVTRVELKGKLDKVEQRYVDIVDMLAQLGNTDGIGAAAAIDENTCANVADAYVGLRDATIAGALVDIVAAIADTEMEIVNLQSEIASLEDQRVGLIGQIENNQSRLARNANSLQFQEQRLAEAKEARDAATQALQQVESQCANDAAAYANDTSARSQEIQIIQQVEETHATQIEGIGPCFGGGSGAAAPGLPSAPFADQGAVNQAIELYEGVRSEGIGCMAQKTAEEDAASAVYLQAVAQLESQIAGLTSLVATRKSEINGLKIQSADLDKELNERIAYRDANQALYDQATPEDIAAWDALTQPEQDAIIFFFEDPNGGLARIAVLGASIADVNASLQAKQMEVDEAEQTIANKTATKAALTEARTAQQQDYLAGHDADEGVLAAIMLNITRLQGLISNPAAPSLPSAPLNDIAQVLTDIRSGLVQQQQEADQNQAQNSAICEEDIANYERQIAFASAEIEEAAMEIVSLESERDFLMEELDNDQQQLAQTQEQLVVAEENVADVTKKRLDLLDRQEQLVVAGIDIGDAIQSGKAGCDDLIVFATDNTLLDHLVPDDFAASRIAFDGSLDEQAALDHEAEILGYQSDLKVVKQDLESLQKQVDETMIFIQQRTKQLQQASKTLQQLYVRYERETSAYQDTLVKLNKDLEAARSAGCNGGPV